MLVQSTQADFNTLSLITDESVTAPGVSWIYDSLVAYRSEEMSSFYGWLADGLSVADDKRTFFIRLHPRARWHDGLPITARDVKFTLDLIQSSIRFRGYFSWVRSVEILGEREIALRLDSELTVSNIFPLSWFPILPAHYWEERDPARASLEPPLGSGPYQVAAVRQGRYIRYERVPRLLGTRHRRQQGPLQLRSDPVRSLSGRDRRPRGVSQGIVRYLDRAGHPLLGDRV